MPKSYPEPGSGPPSRGQMTARVARLSNLGAAERLARYRAGDFDRADLATWAAHFPDETPTVNGDVEWICCKLADLD